MKFIFDSNKYKLLKAKFYVFGNNIKNSLNIFNLANFICLAIFLFIFISIAYSLNHIAWEWKSLDIWVINVTDLKEKSGNLKFMGWIIGGLSLLLTLVYGSKRIKNQEIQIKSQQEQVNQTILNDGITHLADDKTAIRIGGIYVLVNLAVKEKLYAKQVFDILCNHIVLQSQKEFDDAKKQGEKYITTKELQTILNLLFKTKKDTFRSFRADLNCAKLDCAKLDCAKLDYAELNGVQLNNAYLNGVQLNNAKLYYTQLYKTKLNGAQLNNAELLYTELDNAELKHAQLNNAELYYTKLNGAELNNANLSRATINININILYFKNNDFTKTNFHETIISPHLKTLLEENPTFKDALHTDTIDYKKPENY